ncbi:hypothetical protein BDQ94DRAFT_148076 [Aspergillus welwitschiae]|uniref:MADS-box domain-containing protein n=1 Tax=Aspergillus welwitschiae TaxID=1341132 RepID=A0A3F3PVE7_9EURO|nr:hypothetical protein BDQ94DRAFT_148076 [Aspergillus welwitschiae]RDH30845.1 hypothetical protein BDQ94DRAFT_148076 [Aspergillus welwitschiae]
MGKPRTLRHRRSDSAKSRRQQRYRRRTLLLLKAFEFCKECEADVSLMIRSKHNGEIFYFNSDNSWTLSRETLAMHYPRPKQVTWQELAAHYSDPSDVGR